MNKIDIICRRLRDIGVFFLGVAAIISSSYLIYERTHSPEREVQRAMQRAFTQGFEQSLAAGQKK